MHQENKRPGNFRSASCPVLLKVEPSTDHHIAWSVLLCRAAECPAVRIAIDAIEIDSIEDIEDVEAQIESYTL